MFESDLQDEAVKKKKRRVLIGLVFMLMGTLTMIPLANMVVPIATEVAGVTPTLTPAATDTPTPEASEPPSTATDTPTATEENLNGAGGGEDASPTPTSEPAVESPLVTPTPEVPTQLPVTGAGDVYGLALLVVGLALWLVGAVLVRAGLTLKPEEIE